VALDLRAEGPSAFRLESPGFLLHRWQVKDLVTHVAMISDYAGPSPYVGSNGRLIN
jgi:hypothetical protein